jgi:hypothetical protein
MLLKHTNESGQFLYEQCPHGKMGQSGVIVLVGSETCTRGCLNNKGSDSHYVTCMHPNRLNLSKWVDIPREINILENL